MAAGVFATVEKSSLQHRVVAVKSYKAQHGRLVKRHCERELRALRAIRANSELHAWEHHVIYLLDVQKNPSECNLLFPFYDKTLLDLVSSCDQIFAFNAVYQLAQGLDFLHDQGIIHCDLSPSNVLVDSTNNNHMVIADFGCAHFIMQHVTDDSAPSDMEEQDNEEIGTLIYKAPEHLFGSRLYAPSTDIWSLGCIFCHLLRGDPLFTGESDIEQIGQLVRIMGPPPTTVLNEEMCRYPDADKLIFFGDPADHDSSSSHCDDDDDDIISEEDDSAEYADLMAMISAQRQAYANLLAVPYARPLIQGMLNWSVRNRLSTSEIFKLAKDRDDNQIEE
ncbi:hypothetical protein RO3G_07648 [Lichtheimia corymbifera JMRC:FSU:9682]|uniref:Protein kinase domain-containing protein n=1 Tax=Lichtheimia corymbifera JMRC:FSU:9682 TaxID=1263082 RepID=A0A068S566_9FUNG|nr:hypothetical protein RO3G_07648 [Lichtheimia corymbifera JMRC:FSU:9682]